MPRGHVHLDQQEEYEAWEKNQEDLFQEMVAWVEAQGSEYAKVHWLQKADGELASVWCETEKGDEIVLPEKYWDIVSRK